MKPRKNPSAVVRAALPGMLALLFVALSMGGCDLSSLLPAGGSGGNNNPPPVQAVPPPQPVFTRPISNVTAPAGMPVPVSWFAASDSKTVVSQLYYDKDGLKNSGDEVLLTQASKVAKDYSASTFTWDTTGALLGTYRLLVVASDGVNTPVTVYSNYTVTVVDSTPDIEVTEPFSPVSVMPAENVVLKWTQYAPLGPSTVTLYYDDDIDRANGYVAQIATLNQAATSTNGSYVWNVPVMPAGQYYILAELDYGTGTIFSYSAAPMGVSGPAVQLLNPSSPVTWHGGGQLSIRYQVVGAKSGTTITLFYEDNGGTKTNLVTLPITSSNPASWSWTSGPLPTSNPYKIGGIVNDGVNDPATLIAYALGTVTDTGPTFSMTAPATATNLAMGNPLTVGFTYALSSGAATVTFYLDADANLANGYITPALGSTQALPGSSSGSLSVTVPVATAPGDYRILGVFDDGAGTVIEAYASGVVTVTLPQITLTQPAATAEVLIGDQITIAWSGNIPAGNPSMRVFYSPTQDLADPNLVEIQAGIDPNAAPQSLLWTVPNDPHLTDAIYIGATVTTTLGAPVTLWAPVLTIPLVTDSERHLDTMTAFPDNAPNDPSSPVMVFQGFSTGGGLGNTIAGGSQFFSGEELKSPVTDLPGDVNNDGIPDFVLVATTGQSKMLGETLRYGEAYLIYGQNTPRQAGRKIEVSRVPDVWPGAVFPGVEFSGSSEGITSVSFLPDLDNDDKLDLVFGLPNVQGIVHEDQDYDPIDQDKWDPPPPDDPPPAQSLPYPSYPQLLPTAPNQKPQPDSFSVDYNGSFSTGMAIFAASSVATSGFDGKVIPLGDVGQFGKNSLPRAVKGFGMRVYPQSLIEGGSAIDATRWGSSVAVADLDNDGIADWLISCPGGGFIQIIFGRTYSGGFNPGALPAFPGAANSMHALSYPYVRQHPPSGTAEDRRMEVPWVFRDITGEGVGLDKPIDIGDFNNDSLDDVACVAPNFDGNKGAAYIVFGHPSFGAISVGGITNDADSVRGLKLVGSAAGQTLGTSHARFGDLNGDGYDDYAVGVPGYTALGRNGCGAVVAVFGGANVHGSWTLADVGDPATGKKVPGVIIVGGNAGDRVGQFTATAGDVDGDGNLDVLVAAPNFSYAGTPAKAQCGAVYLIYGGPALRPRDGVIDLVEVGRTVRGKVYIGPNANDNIGPVSAAGDVDADGKGDFIIGNPKASPRDITGAGECYLIYGSDRKDP